MCNCKQNEFELLPELEAVLNEDQRGLFPEKNLLRLRQGEFEDPIVESPETKYQDIISNIQAELNRRFRNTTDPGLRDRRNKLLVLFSSVPPVYSKNLYEKLQNATDPLGRLFRYKLKIATRNELLSILRMRMTIPAVPVINPMQQPKKQELWSVINDLSRNGEPLPISLNGEFENATKRFISILQSQGGLSYQLNGDRTQKLLCILKKLLQSGTDDRIVIWCKIRPTPTDQGGSKFGDDSREICVLKGIRPLPENLLFKNIKAKEDIERANDQIKPVYGGFIEHLKTNLLQIQVAYPDRGDETRILKGLNEQLDQMYFTIKNLRLMADPHLGGIDMPVYYVAIKDWIAEKQRDSRTVYTC